MFLEESPEKKFIDTDEKGNPLMTPRTLRHYLEKQNIPLTPPPPKLYLNYKGFKQINAEGIKEINENGPESLWLDHNSIEKINPLDDCCPKLILLHLNNNIIERIPPLYNLRELHTLNLANNKIERIQNLQFLIGLASLNVSHNFLSVEQTICGLIQAEKLSSLDMSNNEIACSEEVFGVLSKLKLMNCLYLKSTPFNRGFKNYRKRLVGTMKALKFLDDRPVQAEDHRLAQAFLKGGIDFERQERARILQEKQIQNKKSQQQFEMKHGKEKQKTQQEKIVKKKPLEERLKELEEKEMLNEEQTKEIRRIRRKIQEITHPKPKGFLASVSDTKIKIMNVSDEEEEQEIIQEYFSTEKQKIEERIKNKGEDPNKAKLNELQRKYQQEHLSELQNMIDADLSGSEDIEASIKTKWNKKYEPLLEALLEKYRFDFSEVQPSFNMILADINKKMMRVHDRFEVKELRLIWTQVEKRRRRQKAEGLKEERENMFINQ